MNAFAMSSQPRPAQPAMDSTRYSGVTDAFLPWALHRHGIALSCRTAELAGALRRFRERQAEINAGFCGITIQMPPVATASWISA